MSRLTQVMQNYSRSRIVHSLVDYLEKVDIPGPQRKEIAIQVLKALHLSAGSEWDDKIEDLISGAIEYVLGEVRDYAQRFGKDNENQNPPTGTGGV